MSSEIYIIHQKEVGLVEYFELTCTSEISIVKRSNVTDVPVEQGFSVADNSFPEPIRFNLKGIISDIKNYSLDYHRSPEDSIKAFHNLMDSRAVFTLAVDDSLETYDNVVIENINLLKSSGMGTSWSVNIDMKQIIITNKAKNITFPPQAPETEKQARAKAKQGDNSTEDKPLDTTLFINAAQEYVGSGFFAQAAGAFGRLILGDE